MPGAPKKRAEQERAAKKRLEVLAKAQAEEKALALPRKVVRYSPELAADIAALIASGVPIVDSTINGAVVSPGVATRMGIHPATIYEWQLRYPEFAEAVSRARQESADRVADRMLALADVALAEPAMANSVRVAADIMRWQAGVRGPHIYGERKRIEVKATADIGEQLRRALRRERVVNAGLNLTHFSSKSSE
jgi:hypothetical protein